MPISKNELCLWECMGHTIALNWCKLIKSNNTLGSRCTPTPPAQVHVVRWWLMKSKKTQLTRVAISFALDILFLLCSNRFTRLPSELHQIDAFQQQPHIINDWIMNPFFSLKIRFSSPRRPILLVKHFKPFFKSSWVVNSNFLDEFVSHGQS